jgi:hypothetical protein
VHAHLLLLVLLQIVPGDGLVVEIINAALTMGLPVLGAYLFTEVSKFVLKADTWSAFAKRILVFVWATIIAGIDHALGLHLPEAFGALTQPDVLIALTAGLTYLAHQILNKPAA